MMPLGPWSFQDYLGYPAQLVQIGTLLTLLVGAKTQCLIEADPVLHRRSEYRHGLY